MVAPVGPQPAWAGNGACSGNRDASGGSAAGAACPLRPVPAAGRAAGCSDRHSQSEPPGAARALPWLPGLRQPLPPRNRGGGQCQRRSGAAGPLRRAQGAIWHPGPHMDQPFNFSRMVNLGVAATRAELVVLLNNDVRFSAPGQIEQLLAGAMRPEVGVVGCRLLYPDGTTQHAGMLLRSGKNGAARIRAAHVYRGAARQAAGYLHQLETTRNWQAVTGAVMAMRREVFDRVGGFDEVALPVEFNDVDFCLRVRESGLRV